MAIKKHDFIEIEYTAKIKDGNIVFDTTDEKVAKENTIHSQEMEYGPITICIGEQQILKGLEAEIEGKEPGRHIIELEPENAFGKKNAKLIQLISTSKFLQQKIQPVPGLQINIDGMMGLIKTVSGGRTLVDFNHPLSGKAIIYDIKINKIVSDDKEKIKAYLKLNLKLDIEVEITEGKARIRLKKELPKDMQEGFSKKIKELLPSIKEVEFIIQEEQKK